MDNHLTLIECKPKLLLFRNVTNSPEVRAKIIKAELQAALINPRYVWIKTPNNFNKDEL